MGVVVGHGDRGDVGSAVTMVASAGQGPWSEGSQDRGLSGSGALGPPWSSLGLLQLLLRIILPLLLLSLPGALLRLLSVLLPLVLFLLLLFQQPGGAEHGDLDHHHQRLRSAAP